MYKFIYFNLNILQTIVYFILFGNFKGLGTLIGFVPRKIIFYMATSARMNPIHPNVSFRTMFSNISLKGCRVNIFYPHKGSI